MIKQKARKYGDNENAPGIHQRFWQLYRTAEWLLGLSAPVRSKVTTDQSQVRMESISWHI